MKIKNNYPKEAGIYKLTCNINNKIYIGKSVNIYSRLAAHKWQGKNSNIKYYLQSVILKYGWDNFRVDILEIVDNFDKVRDNNFLLERETYYIDLFESHNPDKGYNICKYSNDRSGVKHSEETKEKIRISKLGKKTGPFSKESRENMRISALNRPPRSDEHREKLRKANLGKKMSDESKEKLRLLYKDKPSKRKNFKHSDESKEKIGRAVLGRKHSEESKERMSIAQTGIKNKRPGYKHSEETKEKMRKSANKQIQQI